jgi:hypothetical protein
MYGDLSYCTEQEKFLILLSSFYTLYLKKMKRNFMEKIWYISQISKLSFSISPLMPGRQSTDNKYHNSANQVLRNSNFYHE